MLLKEKTKWMRTHLPHINSGPFNKSTNFLACLCKHKMNSWSWKKCCQETITYATTMGITLTQTSRNNYEVVQKISKCKKIQEASQHEAQLPSAKPWNVFIDAAVCCEHLVQLNIQPCGIQKIVEENIEVKVNNSYEKHNCGGCSFACIVWICSLLV